jgi:hypothetical protein
MKSRLIALRSRATVTVAAACLLAICPLSSLFAEQPPASPGEIVRTAFENQRNDITPPPYFSWMERKHHGSGTQVERCVETPDGTLSRVVLINNMPLSTAQKEQEAERVREMADPQKLREKQKETRQDDARTEKMLAAIPDAFDFTYVDSSTAPNGHKLLTLGFAPRHGFQPPSRETAVFLGMQGEITIDQTAMRIEKIDGTLFKDVTFGWGIFGRLHKGGRFYVEQAEVTPTHWEGTHMLIHFDGRALLFPVHYDDNEESWDYQTVPAMSVQDALNYLDRAAAPPQDAELRTHPSPAPASIPKS